ncbi:hypothetical protein [Pseudonocardia sp. WMMC193]|uniref:hypothetical protein n=1 Tax=Pseudonocardia sp. WMMC193 TaxID=2911965 RepID=UPI001F443436|nr:hypothetical protein [Pseudonocardia sp. WMMC193]MCF7547937.1 hypothetical protein [Pseudonocardia sp. WMMC193]
MFGRPVGDPVVADVVGRPSAPRYAALLMSSAHGIAGMEHTGHLTKDSRQVDADQLVRMLIESIRPRTGGDARASP